MRLRTSRWWGDLAMAAGGCLAAGLLVAAAGARAAEAVASNLDLMTRLTSDVVIELEGRFREHVGERAVRLKPFAAGEDYYFVTGVLVTELTRAGVTTLQPQSPGGAPNPAGVAGQSYPGSASTSPTETGGDAGGGGALTLQYQNVAFDMKYVDSHRSYLVGGKRIERRANVRIMATLSDADGRVLWVGEGQRESTDEFDYGDAARVEAGSYQFARPVMPPGGWGRYAEPVFVTGIIVGLIYLFFSNQSDN